MSGAPRFGDLRGISKLACRRGNRFATYGPHVGVADKLAERPTEKYRRNEIQSIQAFIVEWQFVLERQFFLVQLVFLLFQQFLTLLEQFLLVE